MDKRNGSEEQQATDGISPPPPKEASRACPDCEVRRAICARALDRQKVLLARTRAAEAEVERLRRGLTELAKLWTENAEAGEEHALGRGAKVDLDDGPGISAMRAIIAADFLGGCAKQLRELLSAKAG
jgi:hypothetical protein